MSLKQVHLIAFPQTAAADLSIQLGRLAPDTPVESADTYGQDQKIDSLSLVFLWDSMLAPAILQRLFTDHPQASVVVLTETGNRDRASDLMRMGAMDYRTPPFLDELLEIYIRKVGHHGELVRQASNRRQEKDLFISNDVEVRRLLDQIALIAPSRASVLIIGESGTGKERLARYIHKCSDRRDAAFIAINCAAIPEGILEAELFGAEKGAFTGATTSRAGKFELAHNGTFLLDEITEMPLHLQPKLLRVLQEGEVDRLGGKRPVKIDVRFIATSNRDIGQSVADGQIRQDLYYRLNVITIQLPPLRQRPCDISCLARHFLSRFSETYNRPAPELGKEAVDALEKHSWPGNVRELENCMHRAILMCTGKRLKISDLTLLQPAQESHPATDIAAGMSIRDMERVLIKQTLDHVKGNRTEAAKLLGISIRTLRNKLHEYSGTLLAGSSLKKEQPMQTNAFSPGGLS